MDGIDLRRNKQASAGRTTIACGKQGSLLALVSGEFPQSFFLFLNARPKYIRKLSRPPPGAEGYFRIGWAESSYLNADHGGTS